MSTMNRRTWNLTMGLAAAGVRHGGRRRPAEKPISSRFTNLTIYVSPSGNDGWSGVLPSANPRHSDGPVAGIQRALEIIRKRRKARNNRALSVRILLRGGIYELKKSIILEPEDSGTAQMPLVIAAYPGEKPVISGGVTVGNWKARRDGLWEAPAPAAMNAQAINQLFVRGQRQDRPRLPDKNWYFMAGLVERQELRNRAFLFEKGQLNPNWYALRDVEVVSFESWTTERQWLQTIDPKTDTAYLQNQGHDFGTFEIRQRFYIDNVREALHHPGQWYFDRSPQKILYLPEPNQPIDGFNAVVPILRHLVEFRGDPESHAHVGHIAIQGICFQYAACAVSRAALANDIQAATRGWEAAIFGNGVQDVKILGCAIAHGGEHAIRFMGASRRVVVAQCHMEDMGGGGVYLGLDCPLAEYYQLPPTTRFTGECVVDNNFIHDGGKLFPQACGIWVGHAGDNQIRHNVITNLYYTGISTGWNWATTPSPAVRNIVEFNRVYQMGNGVLSDAGGIYTLGVSPGTQLRNNWLSNLVPYNAQRMFNGVYLDEGSSHILVEDNIVQKADGMGLLLNYGIKNSVLNNVFEQTEGIFIERNTDTYGKRIPLSLIFDRNIVVVDGRNVLPPYSHAGWRFNHNVYWSSRGIVPTIHGVSFKQWQATGQDSRSLVAFPGLHTVHGVIRAEPGSAANQAGFRPIETGNIGLYGPAAWRALPGTIRPLPIADRTPCPMPTAKPVQTTFQREKAGDYPYGAITWGNGNRIAGPAEITGRQSLRIGPHAVTYTYYQPWLRESNLILKFSILIPKHIGTTLVVELRDWRSNPYITGPSVRFGSDASVLANGIPVGRVPLGKWVDVRVHYDYRRETSRRHYRISLSCAAKELASRKIQISGAAGFGILTWLGFINQGKVGQECYVGYIDCGPESR